MAGGSHPDPFRTRSLSLPAPMVLLLWWGWERRSLPRFCVGAGGSSGAAALLFAPFCVNTWRSGFRWPRGGSTVQSEGGLVRDCPPYSTEIRLPVSRAVKAKRKKQGETGEHVQIVGGRAGLPGGRELGGPRGHDRSRALARPGRADEGGRAVA